LSTQKSNLNPNDFSGGDFPYETDNSRGDT
jgi:hypothetical protein